jgi:hypothetical protein
VTAVMTSLPIHTRAAEGEDDETDEVGQETDCKHSHYHPQLLGSLQHTRIESILQYCEFTPCDLDFINSWQLFDYGLYY